MHDLPSRHEHALHTSPRENINKFLKWQDAANGLEFVSCNASGRQNNPSLTLPI
jgi:hypothetical protein